MTHTPEDLKAAEEIAATNTSTTPGYDGEPAHDIFALHCFLEGSKYARKEMNARIAELEKERDGFKNGQMQLQYLLSLALDDKLGLVREGKDLQEKLRIAVEELEKIISCLNNEKRDPKSPYLGTGKNVMRLVAIEEFAQYALSKIRGEHAGS